MPLPGQEGPDRAGRRPRRVVPEAVGGAGDDHDAGAPGADGDAPRPPAGGEGVAGPAHDEDGGADRGDELVERQGGGLAEGGENAGQAGAEVVAGSPRDERGPLHGAVDREADHLAGGPAAAVEGGAEQHEGADPPRVARREDRGDVAPPRVPDEGDPAHAAEREDLLEDVGGGAGAPDGVGVGPAEAGEVADQHDVVPRELLGEGPEAAGGDAEPVDHHDGARGASRGAQQPRVDPDAARRGPRAQGTRVRLAGHVVRYEASGEGPAVVLVHGLGGSARWWRRTVAALSQAHRVIVPELPGFGYGLGGRRFRLEDAPVVLGGLLDRLALGPASLVGHSFGAMVCLGVAVARPEAVDRLVLIGPPVRTASPALAGNVLPALRTVLGLPPPAALTVMTDIATRSPLALLRAAGEILAHDGEPGIARAPAVPTMVVWGARDALVPVGGTGWVARALPDARVRVLPGAGHVPMLDRPDLLDAELRAFLSPG